MNRQRLSKLIIIFVCLVLGATVSYAQSAKTPEPAAKPAEGTKAEAARPADAAPAGKVAGKAAAPDKGKMPKYNIEDFSYAPETSRNPFEPVLLLKAKTARGLSVKTPRMAKDLRAKPEKPDKLEYELEELRLVGVIKSGTGGMIAMMEDSQGKGVFFRKGDYMNKNLWVMDVSASGVMLGYKAKGEIKKIAVAIPTKN